MHHTRTFRYDVYEAGQWLGSQIIVSDIRTLTEDGTPSEAAASICIQEVTKGRPFDHASCTDVTERYATKRPLRKGGSVFTYAKRYVKDTSAKVKVSSLAARGDAAGYVEYLISCVKDVPTAAANAVALELEAIWKAALLN